MLPPLELSFRSSRDTDIQVESGLCFPPSVTKFICCQGVTHLTSEAKDPVRGMDQYQNQKCFIDPRGGNCFSYSCSYSRDQTNRNNITKSTKSIAFWNYFTKYCNCHFYPKSVAVCYCQLAGPAHNRKGDSSGYHRLIEHPEHGLADVEGP